MQVQFIDHIGLKKAAVLCWIPDRYLYCPCALLGREQNKRKWGPHNKCKCHMTKEVSKTVIYLYSSMAYVYRKTSSTCINKFLVFEALGGPLLFLIPQKTIVIRINYHHNSLPTSSTISNPTYTIA